MIAGTVVRPYFSGKYAASASQTGLQAISK